MLSKYRNILYQFGIALTSVTVAFSITYFSWPVLQSTPWALFFAAVIVSAWFRGFASGLIAIIISAGLGNYYIIGANSFTFPMNFPEILPTLVFLVVSLLLVILASTRRQAITLERQQREWFQGTLKSIGDAVIATDANGNVRFMNNVGAKLTGWSMVEALGQPIVNVFKIINEETRQTIENPVGKVLETGSTVGLANHTLLISKDGTERPIDDSAAPIKDENGNVTGVILVFHDVTEKRDAEIALRKSESLKSAIMQCALDCIVSIDHQGKVIEFNAMAESTFGYTRAQVMGALMADMIVPPELRERHNQGMIHYLATGEGPVLGKRIEMPAMRADGTIFPIELAIMRMSGEPPTFTAYIRDLTQQKQAATAVKSAEARFRLMVENLKDYAIISTDPENRLTSWNVGAQQIFGYEEAEVLGQPAGILFTPEDRESRVPEQEMLTARETGRADEERWHIRKNNERFFSSGVMASLRDDNGHLLGYVKIAHDVTRQKEMERTLIEARETAEAANIAKSEFLANMSHEIRTPMNAVIGLSAILARSSPLTPKQKEFINTLQLSADSLLALINDLLDISKIEARSIELEQTPFSITQLVAEVISMMAMRTKEKGLTLESVNHCACAEKRLFIGDPARLRQILLNLCSNAIKFTEKGGVSISVLCKPTDREDIEEVSLCIKDTGIGIASNQLSNIFEKFIQADSSINRKYGGTGLGLAITKTLTEIMGGTIKVESVLGKGSTFTAVLPLQTAISDKLNPAIGLLGDRHITPRDTLMSHVLLVEDYAPNVLVAGTCLEQFGYTYDVATNGADAIEKIKQRDYLVVLMDVQMPDMNGFQATQSIRQYEKQKNKKRLTIIGLTAHALTGDRERCIGAGMDDYIAKPFNPNELRLILGNLSQKAAS